jgi:ribosomal protein S18 acetylase RimI-like enzyme
MVGYSYVLWFEEEGGIYYHSRGFLLPEWRRQGIGRALLRYNEALLRNIAAGHSPDKPHFFESQAAETAVGATALLRGAGYQPAVTFAEMLRPDLENLPDAPLPEGLEVRPVRPEHYRAIWEAHDEASRDHWGYVSPDEGAYQRWLDDPITFQPELWKIAWDGDRVAGQVKSFIRHAENAALGRLRGCTEFISVGRPWRRRGLARALLVQSLRALKERGMAEAVLGVHTDNPNEAFRLYESVGFRVAYLDVVYQKPMDDTQQGDQR